MSVSTKTSVTLVHSLVTLVHSLLVQSAVMEVVVDQQKSRCNGISIRSSAGNSGLRINF